MSLRSCALPTAGKENFSKHSQVAFNFKFVLSNLFECSQKVPLAVTCYTCDSRPEGHPDGRAAPRAAFLHAEAFLPNQRLHAFSSGVPRIFLTSFPSLPRGKERKREREKERKGEREKERNKEGRKEEKKRKRSLSFVYSSRQTLLLTWEESWAPIQF